MAEREKREAANRVKANSTGWQKHIKPPLYTKIKFNQAVGDCPVYKADPLDQQTCECDSQNDEVNPYGYKHSIFHFNLMLCLLRSIKLDNCICVPLHISAMWGKLRVFELVTSV